MHSDRVRRILYEEVRRLGGHKLVVSSNVPIRGDGMPYADAARRRMDDPGVAVYFTLKERPFVMAQDKFVLVEHNLRSLTLAIEAMRSLERHGGGSMMERAFSGFAALPPPANAYKKWWEVFGFSEALIPELDVDIVTARYRKMARSLHSDAGGDDSAMADLNRARDEANDYFKTR